MRLLEQVKAEVNNLCESEKTVDTLEALLTPDWFMFFIKPLRIVVGYLEKRSLNGVQILTNKNLQKGWRNDQEVF
ncbi:hypothetical protein DPMN_120244 [Dreissena polymorpha]|uniref:Uncharacterized protein n=1 Tax=Dreissena polymorpha TaxID=45954 RepID=A0A9D4JRX1_DREPO|nr:hypothetical protein DPMN_120244 [Dreissena polymorpha]